MLLDVTQSFSKSKYFDKKNFKQFLLRREINLRKIKGKNKETFRATAPIDLFTKKIYFIALNDRNAYLSITKLKDYEKETLILNNY